MAFGKGFDARRICENAGMTGIMAHGLRKGVKDAPEFGASRKDPALGKLKRDQ
jgi:hypothetical protein